MQNPVLIENSTMQGIANAIRTKTDTNNTMLPSQMASLIASIQSGSSDLELPDCVHMGTFTVANDTIDAQTFEHGFDTIPSNMICFVDEISSLTATMSITGGLLFSGYKGIGRLSSNGSINIYTSKIPTMDETTVTIPNISSSYKFRAGFTYRWIAWR